MLTSLASARAAEPPRLAVFDFEMLDAHTGGLVAVANADMRGNIDESGGPRDPLSHTRAVAGSEFRRARAR